MLEAIYEAADADGPRLAYADWLEDHAEPAQAEFVHLQCAFARTEPQSAENVALWNELLTAWTRLKDELRPALDGLWQIDIHDFRRGFLNAPLDVSPERLDELSANWWPRFVVRAVSTTLAPWNVDRLARCDYLPRLRELVVRGTDIHGNVIPRLVESDGLKWLRVLDLTEFTLGPEAAQALARANMFAELRELRLPYFMRPTGEIGRMLKNRFGDICRF